MHLKTILFPLLCGIALQAGDLPPAVTAKFLKAIANGCGEFQVTCKDAALKAALSALGVSVEDGSSIAWCTSAGEAKAQLQQGRLVVVGHREMAGSACVVVEEEGGRSRIVFNTSNLRNCKVKVGDTLMKIGEKM